MYKKLERTEQVSWTKESHHWFGMNTDVNVDVKTTFQNMCSRNEQLNHLCRKFHTLIECP